MNTKNKILQESEELFLRYGIKSVTMDDISRKLGISKKTLYQYVENKNDLLAQIMFGRAEKHKEDIEKIRTKSIDAIDELLNIGKLVTQEMRRVKPTTMYDLQKYYRDIWKIMENLHVEHIYAVIKENLETGIKQGLYRAELNTDIVAKLYVGKTLLVVDEEMFPLRDYDRENLFNEYIHYHLHGIVSDKGLKLLNEKI